MAEIFGNNNGHFKNFIGEDPYTRAIQANKMPPVDMRFSRNASGFNACCGYAATGDEEAAITEAEAKAPAAAKSTIVNLKTWNLAKTALALVGLYAVVTFAYKKFKK